MLLVLLVLLVLLRQLRLGGFIVRDEESGEAELGSSVMILLPPQLWLSSLSSLSSFEMTIPTFIMIMIAMIIEGNRRQDGNRRRSKSSKIRIVRILMLGW